MWVDEIVEETRKAREEYAAKFEYDIEAIVADVKEKEKLGERLIASHPPKQPLLRYCCVSHARFLNDKLRDKQLKLRATVRPPLLRNLLMSSHD